VGNREATDLYSVAKNGQWILIEIRLGAQREMSLHRPYGTWLDLIAGVLTLKRRANEHCACGALPTILSQ
jgi:hypothetical protein